MNCDWTRQNIALYVYDELRDDERYDFERHIATCEPCKKELADVRDLRMTMSSAAVVEPSPNLLASSRMKLQEALEHEKQGFGWRRFTFDFAGLLHTMKFAPALTAALLILGFTGGVLTTWELANKARTGKGTNVAAENPTPIIATNPPAVASISGITQEPGTNKVKIEYNTLQPQVAEGNLDDKAIQQLLLYAARNNMNTGVRSDSINLLSQNPDDQNVREALIFALRYDRNPGVRLRAIQGLQQYVKDDVRVRDAVIEALMKDSNPGVRAQAVAALQPVKGDGAVQGAFAALANDKDTYIRREARHALATAPQME